MTSARAQGTYDRCQSERGGCFTFEVFAVKDSNHPLLVDVKSGRKSVHEVALEVWQAVKRGEIQLSSADFLVYVFALDMRRMQRANLYENPDGGWRIEHTPVMLRPDQIPPIPTGLLAPSAVYPLSARGKIAMLSIPNEAFTPQTALMFCAPTTVTVVPSHARQEGIWVPASALPWHREHGNMGITFVIVR